MILGWLKDKFDFEYNWIYIFNILVGLFNLLLFLKVQFQYKILQNVGINIDNYKHFSYLFSAIIFLLIPWMKNRKE